jgi:hypothetical protein
MPGGNRSCSESKTTEPVVARDREFTTDMAVDLLTMLVTLRDSPDTTSQRVIDNEVKNDGDTVTVPKSETGGWASLLLWNVNTLIVFVILPITLGGVVFVSLIAVNCITKRCRSHRQQQNIQEEVAASSYLASLVKSANGRYYKATRRLREQKQLRCRWY